MLTKERERSTLLQQADRQFEGFYNMIYQLKADELSTIQFILIDKDIPLRRMTWNLPSIAGT